MQIIEPSECPFVLLIDSAEQSPFTFDGFKCDANKQFRPLIINTRRTSLGRHPNSCGDYSIENMRHRTAVERKSMQDCWGTVMGWETEGEREKGNAGHRDRFKQELANLSQLEAGVVIIEGSFGDCVLNVPEWGSKSDEVNQRIFFRSVLAFQQDYGVPWIFCDTRRMAEQATFRWLERFHRHHKNDGK